MVRFPMTLLPCDSPATPLKAVLVYDKRDPLAVRLTFLQGSRETVSYVFGRDLLAEGLDQRAGLADVVVEPHAELPQEWLLLVLRPESGLPFELYMSRAPVETAVTAMYRLVPMGREQVGAAVDEAIARIFAGEAA
ncbi:SsgA family sporulation/cell division regulator [Nonomuraea endophytica]|uniref:SsgA family sporulation/cell division regulator n=1 Tax=Nonomuraea endophytica TaxID=714136 RepID=UPI0037CC9BB7